MCRAVTCSQCGKMTWAGCGQHVDDLKRSVPASQWCGHQADAAPKGGFFQRLFGASSG
ncbi:MAG: hypothetical protein ACK5H2_07565 [Beutenbergiaceae bacterium]